MSKGLRTATLAALLAAAASPAVAQVREQQRPIVNLNPDKRSDVNFGDLALVYGVPLAIGGLPFLLCPGKRKNNSNDLIP